MTLDQALKEFDEKFPYHGFKDNAENDFHSYLIKRFLTDFYRSLLIEDIERLEGKLKQKTSPRQLYKNDGTVEQIMYYENDSDPAYNSALSSEISHRKQLLEQVSSS